MSTAFPWTKKNDFTWFNVHLVPKTRIRYTKDKEWDEEEQSIYEFYYKRADADNAKRVLKAIMHLAKLSGAKENRQSF
jgi:hypothetical protein